MAPFTLTCVTKRMPHHGGHAGYNALLPHLGASRVITVGSDAVTRYLGAGTRRLRLGRAPGSDWWGAPSAIAELRALRHALSGDNVVHVMYGEDLLGLSSYLSSRRRKVVATFHQPMARIDALHVPRAAVARLDALIALDEGAAKAWRARFSSLAVHALRLGVDTGFWRPARPPARRKRSCLIVGGHLRDFDVLEAVLRRLDTERVQIDLVGVPDAFARRVGDLSRVRRHARISDLVLLELYRSAGAFLLCMRAASGNNALLQALATGCPVVSTDLAGVRSYVGDRAARFVPPEDPEATAAAVLELLDDEPAREALSQAGLHAADAHSLPALAERHWDVYRSLF